MGKSVLNRVRFLRFLRSLGGVAGENFFSEKTPKELEELVRDSIAPKSKGQSRLAPKMTVPEAHKNGFAQWFGYRGTPDLIAEWAPGANQWWCDHVRTAKVRCNRCGARARRAA